MPESSLIDMLSGATKLGMAAQAAPLSKGPDAGIPTQKPFAGPPPQGLEQVLKGTDINRVPGNMPTVPSQGPIPGAPLGAPHRKPEGTLPPMSPEMGQPPQSNWGEKLQELEALEQQVSGILGSFNHTKDKTPEELERDTQEFNTAKNILSEDLLSGKIQLAASSKKALKGAAKLAPVQEMLEGAPKGYMWVDPADKNKGIQRIPGKKKEEKRESAETVGKIMMMETAKALIPTIEQLLFNKDGTINRKNLAMSDIPLVPGSSPMPGTKGAQLAQAMEVGIQAITRIETGAAMPASEVDNTRNRFQPNVWDSDEIVFQKVLSYKFFINGYLDVIERGRDGISHFDKNKLDTHMGKLTIKVNSYKEDWVKRAKRMNPKASVDEINAAWRAKLLNDKDFMLKMAKEMFPSKFKKRGK